MLALLASHGKTLVFYQVVVEGGWLSVLIRTTIIVGQGGILVFGVSMALGGDEGTLTFSVDTTSEWCRDTEV